MAAGDLLKHRKKSRPEKIILDIDSTDDVTHGQQEFSFYHGYYRGSSAAADGETGDLVCALLRPGNQGAAAHRGCATSGDSRTSSSVRRKYVVGFARTPGFGHNRALD